MLLNRTHSLEQTPVNHQLGDQVSLAGNLQQVRLSSEEQLVRPVAEAAYLETLQTLLQQSLLSAVHLELQPQPRLHFWVELKVTLVNPQLGDSLFLQLLNRSRLH